MTAKAALAVLVQAFRVHRLLYAAALAGLIGLALVGVEWRWATWPLLGWSLLLLVHYLLYKSSKVDERWAAERVEELNLKSYDRGHIESIRERQGKDGR